MRKKGLTALLSLTTLAGLFRPGDSAEPCARKGDISAATTIAVSVASRVTPAKSDRWQGGCVVRILRA